MVRRLLNRELDMAYQQWRFWAVDTADKREKATTMVKRLMNKALYEAFNAWGYDFLEATRKKDKARLFLLKMKNAQALISPSPRT